MLFCFWFNIPSLHSSLLHFPPSLSPPNHPHHFGVRSTVNRNHVKTVLLQSLAIFRIISTSNKYEKIRESNRKKKHNAIFIAGDFGIQDFKIPLIISIFYVVNMKHKLNSRYIPPSICHISTKHSQSFEIFTSWWVILTYSLDYEFFTETNRCIHAIFHTAFYSTFSRQQNWNTQISCQEL